MARRSATDRISYTQAVMADLEIRQGVRRGDVAGRLLPELSAAQAGAVLRQALRAHGVYGHNPAANAAERRTATGGSR